LPFVPESSEKKGDHVLAGQHSPSGREKPQDRLAVRASEHIKRVIFRHVAAVRSQKKRRGRMPWIPQLQNFGMEEKGGKKGGGHFLSSCSGVKGGVEEVEGNCFPWHFITSPIGEKRKRTTARLVPYFLYGMIHYREKGMNTLPCSIATDRRKEA